MSHKATNEINIKKGNNPFPTLLPFMLKIYQDLLAVGLEASLLLAGILILA